MFGLVQQDHYQACRSYQCFTGCVFVGNSFVFEALRTKPNPPSEDTNLCITATDRKSVV